MSHRTHSFEPHPLSAVALSVAAAAAITLAPAAARAQDAPPQPGYAPQPQPQPGYAPQPQPGYAPPPAGYAPPPAGYAPPPAGYAPPPAGYAPPPAGYAPPPGAYYPPPGQYAAPGPRVIEDWDETQPIPAGYRKSTKIRTGLVVGGAVTFGVVYLTTALAGAIASDVGDSSGKLLLIPVFGPFTLLGANAGATGDLFLVIDGLAQAAGLGMFIAGLAAPRNVLLRNDVAKVTIMPKPMTFGHTGGGLGVTGTF